MEVKSNFVFKPQHVGSYETRCAFLAAVSESELIQTVREVKVVDIEVNSISLSWRATNGVTAYKVSWSHFQGKEPLLRNTTLTLTHTSPLFN